ncbi:MAG: hypothetical protein H6944_00620 [Zoogloeaceae bacterium]|uniref:hypothetical protein n=1 Tax=Denitromonas sp. TaxID=2734609 RepID=UPI002B8B7304|nr:hypothetical protein [Zoogloeaceae bacterium]HPR05626.1 hypothetical protein [Denitromonas sp.]HQU87507.1 hypothetical protein [Denitromonas sp.]
MWQISEEVAIEGSSANCRSTTLAAGGASAAEWPSIAAVKVNTQPIGVSALRLDGEAPLSFCHRRSEVLGRPAGKQFDAEGPLTAALLTAKR